LAKEPTATPGSEGKRTITPPTRQMPNFNKLKPMKINENKGSQMGHTKKIF
jgi:hypothetical protein